MDPRKLSTQELLKLCLETRDEDLWTEFVRRFQRLIAGVIFKRLRRAPPRVDPAMVKDLTQDTFLKLCKDEFGILRRFEFLHENAFYGFLKVVAAHIVDDYFREKNNDKRGGGQEPENIDDLLQPPSDRSSAVDLILNDLRINEIENCLQQRKAEPNFVRDHRIFWLYFRDGFTAHEIAQFPDIGFKTVKGVESALLRLSKWVSDCLGV